MTSSFAASRGALAALAFLSAFVLLLVGFNPGSASAADVTSGTATFNLTSGKAGKVTAIKPAEVAKRFGKGAKVTVKLKRGGFNSVVRSGIAGGIKLASGNRQVKVTGLTVSIYAKRALVQGKLKGKKVNVFTATGKAELDKSARTARLNGAKLVLTPKAAEQVRKALKLKKAPKGKLGTFSLNLKVTSKTPVDPCETDPNAEGCEIVDPYLAQCDVDAVVKVPGSITPAGALPQFTNDAGVTGPAKLAWGFKNSFRNYITRIAGGSIFALDGASTTGAAPNYAGFEFPASGFRYTDNDTPANLADDKAILEGTGTALFCNKPHGFRVAISNPTVVIDGSNSRIDADVDNNLSGNWIPTQRVTIASLDVTGTAAREASGSGSNVKWTDVPASLTPEGSQAVCGAGELDKCSTFYPAGTVLDSVSLSAATDVVADPYFEQCGVPVLNKADNSWTGASALPTLADPLAVASTGTVDWGLRTSFRSYVSGAMSGAGKGADAIQALGGATETNPDTPGASFSFPISGGQYTANDPIDTSDDQAVINGTGTGLICNSPDPFRFWVAYSDPTIVIDGANSRIVATVSQNTNGTGGSWQTAQRIDLASLDLSGVTPIYNKSGSEVTWASVPVILSQNFASYLAGTVLDPITVSAKTAYDTGEGDAAAWEGLATYVKTSLPFPNADPTTGGCTLPDAAGGSQDNARTIDEYLALGSSTTYQWYANPSAPAALPSLASPKTVSAGSLDWGLRSGLRSSVNAGGNINLAGGVTASTSYFGNGGSLGAPPGTYGTGMGAAAAYFSWPKSGAVSQFDAGGAGLADDRAILRTQGTVGLCNDATTPGLMLYGTVISNPTVIIAGANSRIVADVATRYRLSWVRAKVDLATLDLTGVTPTVTDNGDGTTTETWTIPGGGGVKLAAGGEAVLRLLSSSTYVTGANLDGATISATYPTPAP